MAGRTVREDLRDEVRSHYARVASQLVTAEEAVPATGGATCCGPTPGQAAGSGTCCGAEAAPGPTFGASLYSSAELVDLPVAAVGASLGCGNPILLAELREGERVLDLGSGGGIDVLLAARRVGDDGFVYGVDMTDEMLRLAWENAGTAGVENVEFRKGFIEDLPLPDGEVDVVISNCVLNLSTDAPAVLSEMHRVLRPGGRIGLSDVVAEDRLSAAERAERGSFAGCIAGAMSRREYLDGLAAAGFVEAEVTFTHEVADGIHGAIIRAVKPPVPAQSR
jgi:arsenite methyltransferase